jgi:hypothetical protein
VALKVSKSVFSVFKTQFPLKTVLRSTETCWGMYKKTWILDFSTCVPVGY